MEIETPEGQAGSFMSSTTDRWAHQAPGRAGTMLSMKLSKLLLARQGLQNHTPSMTSYYRAINIGSSSWCHQQVPKSFTSAGDQFCSSSGRERKVWTGQIANCALLVCGNQKLVLTLASTLRLATVLERQCLFFFARSCVNV